MSISKFAGKTQTVLGLIEGKELGVTIPHEHIIVDLRVLFNEPSGASEKDLAYKALSLENLSWVRYHPFENLDNVQLLHEHKAIDEVMLFKQAGGNTIVDVTTVGIGRDPEALVHISQATGLNVIMASGYYVGASHPPEMSSKTDEGIIEEIVRDITIGVGDSRIRAGIIKVAVSWPLEDNEKKVMRAAAQAQQLTGASLSMHPGRKEESAFEIIEVLHDAGADLGRIVMCHIDNRIRNHSERCRVAKTGCYIEYDTWGWEGHAPLSLYTTSGIDLPNDTQRVDEIMRLIDEGYINQILISQDICAKWKYVSYGGWGYAHISNYIVPMMLRRGMTNEQINTIMVENPSRMLSFI